MSEGVKRNPDFCLDDIDSEFDYASGSERKTKKRRTDFLQKEHPGEEPKPGRSEANHWFQEEHGRLYRQMSRLRALDAYSRHKEIVNLYYLNHAGSTKLLERDTSKDRTDRDVLEENHKFIWKDADTDRLSSSWEMRMVKKYYDKLFKEYCIVDLQFYKQNKVAMRWRIENEVKSGKGQFQCGNKRCTERVSLTSWEVPFNYVEANEKKTALVKVRLCPRCSDCLNYSSKKRKVTKIKKTREKHSGLDKSKKIVDVTDDKTGKTVTSVSDANAAADHWSGPAPVEVERSVDQDIDAFLDDLFE